MTDTSDLFSPLTLRGVILRNRIGIPPMCTYQAHEGLASDWHLVHLGARAVGGAGLVIAEATAIAPEGRISTGDLGLWTDGQIAPLARIAAFIASEGAAPAKLAHAGRKAGHRPPQAGGGRLAPDAGGWTALAPSALPFAPGDPPPTALDEAGIQRVIAAFVAAARRAVAAGFTVIEVHAAHGYLLHEFLSPLSNRRGDRYGGRLGHRIRLAVEVAGAVRAAIPANLALLVRISATDWVDGGWDLAQSVVLAKALHAVGVDLIDVSSGGLAHDAVVPAKPGYQLSFAATIRREAGIPTAAVGMITEPAQAAEVIATGVADVVLLGRESLRDPQWTLHVATALGRQIAWPAPYARAAPPPRPA